MPNWCENDLEIASSDAKELARFKRFAKTRRGILDVNKFIPYPVAFETMDEASHKYKYYPDGYNHGGYDWCNTFWGTKWGICNAELIGEDFDKRVKKLYYTFSCAWAPCLPVIQKMSEMFPKLTFKLDYFEAGMGFSGRCVYKIGKLIKDRHNSNYRGGRGG